MVITIDYVLDGMEMKFLIVVTCSSVIMKINNAVLAKLNLETRFVAFLLFLINWSKIYFLKSISNFLLDKYSINTSLNKFSVWHIDGTTAIKSVWFLDSTNLQTLSVEISWQSDVQFRSYRGFGEATFVIFKTMESFEC